MRTNSGHISAIGRDRRVKRLCCPSSGASVREDFTAYQSWLVEQDVGGKCETLAEIECLYRTVAFYGGSLIKR